MSLPGLWVVTTRKPPQPGRQWALNTGLSHRWMDWQAEARQCGGKRRVRPPPALRQRECARCLGLIRQFQTQCSDSERHECRRSRGALRLRLLCPSGEELMNSFDVYLSGIRLISWLHVNVQIGLNLDFTDSVSSARAPASFSSFSWRLRSHSTRRAPLRPAPAYHSCLSTARDSLVLRLGQRERPTQCGIYCTPA